MASNKHPTYFGISKFSRVKLRLSKSRCSGVRSRSVAAVASIHRPPPSPPPLGLASRAAAAVAPRCGGGEDTRRARSGVAGGRDSALPATNTWANVRTYRVFIKYCVFSKILKYIPDFGLSRFPFGGISVCTHWQVKYQRCSRTGRV